MPWRQESHTAEQSAQVNQIMKLTRKSFLLIFILRLHFAHKKVKNSLHDGSLRGIHQSWETTEFTNVAS